MEEVKFHDEATGKLIMVPLVEQELGKSNHALLFLPAQDARECPCLIVARKKYDYESDSDYYAMVHRDAYVNLE